MRRLIGGVGGKGGVLGSEGVGNGRALERKGRKDRAEEEEERGG